MHRGFAAAFARVRDDLDRALASCSAQRPVWFTGHSLGAAIATLAAYHYRTIAGGVYTFGSPLVGNGEFATRFMQVFAERSLRYTNDHDAVTRVPPERFAFPHGRFTHVEHQRWITRDGHVGTLAPTIPHFVEDVFGRANALLDVIRIRTEGVSVSLPMALTDHTPLYYALHTWNDFALNGEPA